MAVKPSDGSSESPGKLALASRLDGPYVHVGANLKDIGHPSVAARRSIWLEKIIMAEGTEIIDPLVEDELVIEAERRDTFVHNLFSRVPNCFEPLHLICNKLQPQL